MVSPAPLEDAPATEPAPAVTPDPTPDAPVSAEPTVTFTVAQVQKMIADAVAAGAAASSGVIPLGSAPIPPPPLPDWSANELLKQLAYRTRWFTETDARAAVAAIDKHFPAPVEE